MSGHDVIEPVNGTAAWRELQQPDSPALANLDWMMPELEGPEIGRGVRAV